jgi:hypothetical protein
MSPFGFPVRFLNPILAEKGNFQVFPVCFSHRGLVHIDPVWIDILGNKNKWFSSLVCLLYGGHHDMVCDLRVQIVGVAGFHKENQHFGTKKGVLVIHPRASILHRFNRIEGNPKRHSDDNDEDRGWRF